MSVKIAALEAENVKRIKAVALTPSPTGLTIVGGNNNPVSYTHLAIYLRITSNAPE